MAGLKANIDRYRNGAIKFFEPLVHNTSVVVAFKGPEKTIQSMRRMRKCEKRRWEYFVHAFAELRSMV